jgi:hypothetical protein
MASVVEYGYNIQVDFLPSNTTSLLQSMDQGVIATFKTYYMLNCLRNILSRARMSTKKLHWETCGNEVA